MSIDWLNTITIKSNNNNLLENLKNILVNYFKVDIKIININYNLGTLKLVIISSKNKIINILDDIISNYKKERIIYNFNCKGDDGSNCKGRVIKEPDGICIEQEQEEELKKKNNNIKTMYVEPKNDYNNIPTMIEAQSSKFC